MTPWWWWNGPQQSSPGCKIHRLRVRKRGPDVATLERELAHAKGTISRQERVIFDLKAENEQLRREARRRNNPITSSLTALPSAGSFG